MTGIGIDIVDVDRLAAAMRRTEGLAHMVFTAAERSCQGRRHPERQLATYFAAKEAFLKAVGLGIWDGIPLREIEVVEDGAGRLQLALGPRATRALEHMGCHTAVLGASHRRREAIAVVMVQ